MSLKIVDPSPIYADGNLHVMSLYERLEKCIDDYAEKHTLPVTRAEIVGTLEFLKAHYMGALE